MPSPPIQLFLTTIASQPALRQRQEYILRILQVKKIPFISYDLASDEDAKRLWKRKAPLDKQQLPGILVGGKFPGTFTDFEEAVEYDELATFLRLNEPYNPAVEEDRPLLREQPIGVPGASSPSQMAKPEHRAAFNTSPSPSPLRTKTSAADVRKRDEAEFDVGQELVGYGLQGLKVTHDDLLQLVQDLGLEGDDAGDLVQGLSEMTVKDKKKGTGKADKESVQGEERKGAADAKDPPQIRVETADVKGEATQAATQANAAETSVVDVPASETST